MSSFAENTGEITFSGYGQPGYITRAFPTPAQPNPDSTTYGDVKPGNTKIGFGLAPSTKARLEEILVDVASKTGSAYGNVLAGQTQRVTRKSTKGAPLDRSLVQNSSPWTASDVLTSLNSNRQLIIILVAAGLFVFIMMKARV